MSMYEVIAALDGVTATTTSAEIPIAGAKKVVMVYKRANHAAGKTVFSATVSVDGTNYIAYNKWIVNTADTNAESETRVASVDTGAANATGFLTMCPEDGFLYIKATATETTDGTHSVWFYIER
jgi:hypothetical protein